MPAVLAGAHWTVAAVEAGRDGPLILRVEPTRPAAPCPSCGTLSQRRHSQFWRRPRDLPWRGTPVRLQVRVRRFFCDLPDCPRRTFAERFDGLLVRRAQRTDGATDLLLAIALRAGGEAGARLARAAGLPVSPDTLLRLLRTCGTDPVPTPRVLGVDDVALRRGRRYATILVDLERHQPIDLLLGRETAPLAEWLTAHPGVEVLVRDRAEAYAEAGRQGAPHAIQVADRFHLDQNASAALDEVLRGRRRQLEVATTTADAEPGPIPTAPVRPASRRAQQQAAARARRVARWEEVRTRHAAGQGIRHIARETGLHRQTVHRLLATADPPRNAPRPPRLVGLTSPSLQPYVTYLEGRWQAGCHGIAQLYREIAAQGYVGSRSLLYQALQPWRGPRPPPIAGATAHRTRPRVRRASARWLCLRPPERLDPDERAALQQFLDEEPDVARGYGLLQRFRRIITERALPDLESWVVDAEGSDLPAFVSLAHGIRADQAAVEAALTLKWSNGPVEGHNHRVKLLKRAGYGRCALDLLRARVVTAA